MVTCISPDIVLTGNAERYLSAVAADRDAPPFFMYPYLRNQPPEEQAPEFIEAFRAACAPHSAFARSYMSDVRHQLDTGLNMQHRKETSIKVLIGPSHVVRWRQQLADGAFPINRFSKMVGWGGAPVWSEKLLRAATEVVPDGSERIVLMVGDFRFGNAVLLQAGSPAEHVTEHAGITARAISPANDALMRDRALSALTVWRAKLGSKLQMIFWDLFCRQVLDRLEGKYISSGTYTHPIWTLSEVQDAVGMEGVVDLCPLLSLRPMHEVMRLFVDDSCHPSYAGYAFLTAILTQDTPVVVAFDSALSAVESQFVEIAAALVAEHGPILMSGRSVWLDTLFRCLGPTGIKRLSAVGLVVETFNSQLGHPPPRSHSERTMHLPSGAIGVRRVKEGLDSLTQNGAEPEVVYCWQEDAAAVICSRSETPTYTDGGCRDLRHRAVLQLTSSNVELGPMGLPTHQGLMLLFSRIANDLRIYR
jgi:hypothetical protein